MKKQVSGLSIAVAAALGAGAADAAVYTATLVNVNAYSPNGSSAANLSSSTATWSYNDATNLLTQTGGTYNMRLTTSPTSTLYRHSITGLVIGNNGGASATTFTCTEGNFGGGVGANLCGNYSFGANFNDESTATWGPGVAKSRTLGGDDVAFGPQQQLADYAYFTTVSWVGTTLTLSNATCNPYAPNNLNSCAAVGGANQGFTWTLNAGPQVSGVPVPAAVWLFGSALGLMGAARRRATKA